MPFGWCTFAVPLCVIFGDQIRSTQSTIMGVECRVLRKRTQVRMRLTILLSAALVGLAASTRSLRSLDKGQQTLQASAQTPRPEQGAAFQNNYPKDEHYPVCVCVCVCVCQLAKRRGASAYVLPYVSLFVWNTCGTACAMPIHTTHTRPHPRRRS